MVQNSIIKDQILQYFNITGINDIPIDLLFMADEAKKENIDWNEKVYGIYKLPHNTLNLYRHKRHALFSYLYRFECNEYYQKTDHEDDEKITIGQILYNHEIYEKYILKYFDIDTINDMPIFILSLASDCKNHNSTWADEIDELYKDNAVGVYLNLSLMELILYLEHIFNIIINDEESCEIITLRDLINKVQEKLLIKNQ